MKTAHILITLLFALLFVCSGCFGVNTIGNPHSTIHAPDIFGLGYKVVNSWLGKTGEIVLLKSSMSGSYWINGEGKPFKKGYIKLKTARLDKVKIWHLRDFDALILIGESSSGKAIHEIVSIFSNTVEKVVLPADTTMLYKESSDLRKLVLAEVADSYKNSKFHVFSYRDHEGPLPYSRVKNLIEQETQKTVQRRKPSRKRKYQSSSSWPWSVLWDSYHYPLNKSKSR